VIARGIDSCESKRDLAALTLRFADVLREIEAAGGAGGLTGEDATFDESRKAPRREGCGTRVPS
jgi:hypothetical protein